MNNKSIKVPGGLQRIKTPDGYVHPLKIKDGLVYVSIIRPYTDKEWDKLPHVIWTRDLDWNPNIFDHEFDDDDDEWYDAISDLADLFEQTIANELPSPRNIFSMLLVSGAPFCQMFFEAGK